MMNPIASPMAGAAGTLSAAGAASGGLPGTGGSLASAGATSGAGGSIVGAAGAGGASGASGSGGEVSNGGAAMAGAGAGAGGEGGGAGEPVAPDERPWFTFFATSMNGLLALAHDGEVPGDLENAGFGGDLGGLEGADEICATLAKQGNPGDNKTWRAFLSTAPGGPGDAVNAIDRIGEGPWYDYNNRLLANDLEGLMPAGGSNGGRPEDADPQLGEMFTDENGQPIQLDDEDNHDFLTASNEDGELLGNLDETCQNWTFNGEYPNDVDVRIGHAWPRSSTQGRHWISEHDVNGCMPGVHLVPGGGAPRGDQRVGSGGGYGGIYCFALTP